EVFSSGRKRASDSGYLSSQTEGTSAHKRKVEPQPEGEESNSAMTDCSPEGAGPSAEEEGLICKGARSYVKGEEPVNELATEPESDLTSGITAAFKTFKTQLEEHFTGCWKKVENEVLLSLKDCQQHISTLLTAVHQHRLLLLQRFESSVTDQLIQLDETSTNLNSTNTQILVLRETTLTLHCRTVNSEAGIGYTGIQIWIQSSAMNHSDYVLVGAELEISHEHTEEFGGSSSSLQQEVFSSGRKRASDSGYLSSQTEGTSAHKRKVEPQPEGEESNSAMTDCSPEGAGPSAEEEGLICKGARSYVKGEEPVNELATEPESDLTSGITAAFKTFKTQLEEHFTGCWKKVENEVLLSLKDCQQHISTLLTAVHQHRLLLLQRFESSVTDQLIQLDETSTNLNSTNTQILSFFQSEIQRLGSFCDEHLQRSV
ncbi:uncharacterized protein LOC111649597, partial [Seriola lalandi dorsalis]|uniref:uncharacterized protein LOC111649597 n=1 Tax=Seriola lalandi dorsalis TaxID=1841481 RepID=UPI000C6F9E6A